MMPEVHRQVLLDVGADLDWPDALGLVSAGEAAWRDAVNGAPGLTPLERVRLLAAVAPLMLSITEGGRARLDRWNARPTPAAPRALIRRELAFFGDRPMLEVVADTLVSLPPCVQAMTMREVAIVAVGWDTGGWTSGAELLGPDSALRRRLVVLHGGERDAELLAHRTRHELAHAWGYHDRVGALPTLLAIGEEGLAALASEEGWAHQAAASKAVGERRAEALALAWGCAVAARP